MKDKVEKFDWKETLAANGIYSLFFFFFIVFTLRLTNLVNNFQSEEIKLLGTIILAFVVIKLSSYFLHPKIVFKTKEGKIVYS